MMLELDQSWQDTLVVNDCLLKSDGSGTSPIVVSNANLATQVLRKGTAWERLLLLSMVLMKNV